VKESEDSKMDEKIKQKLKAYRNEWANKVIRAITPAMQEDDTDAWLNFRRLRVAEERRYHATETYANMPVDELKLLYTQLMQRLRELAEVSALIRDEQETAQTVFYHDMAAMVLRWHGWEYAHVTTVGAGSEYRWVRIEESEEAE
jgi:hypothetical protein